MTRLIPTSKCILVMAGGTGGHIFPGLAVAEYLRLEGWRVHWLGNPSGMEFDLIKQSGFAFEPIDFGGVRGKGLFVKLRLPFNLYKAMWQSLRIMRRIKPSVMLGMGGYVSFPGALVGVMSGIPLVLHEQNSVAGMANRVLATVAKRVLCAFPKVLAKAQWVGNPLRSDLLQIPTPEIRYQARTGVLRLLVVGGSLGATALNDIVPKALQLIPLEVRPEVLHQAGAKHIEQLTQNYQDQGVQAQVVPFIEKMATAYAGADIVICRSGAMTVAELAACGVPSLLVPFPFAVDDHQTKNAQYLAAVGAAKLIAQKDLTPQLLADWLMSLNREMLLIMAQNALKQAKPFATQSVAEICKEVSTT
ncbi:undecaprenyldiphospho-muramoylpentapeptide beta-N-acetylglucosaminyltransferase [Polynucleobacter kasalickyi]|uniref:UDP-N-acetylglucosamine--N-acetylmuramyl-(pentapeptide) pyrophosphoryl-undecaprenol N-acetylglucosamine transferase n=1 Tax=Polynucleobacter kasalickyi TaxID=1938817 RepID=A0A1W2AFB5_9BURK|nr:undecaprenyldiphospho-muramoylpentapeptide beta-N-acetylglucosaminyltransferase [Polynucleobacter kasalickyi]SMC58938.1 UDP-N-acetylglucosamine-N-acetylmuramylpentapeptide N-acetylglucosamine transferase [Polynucleobacter kasalickyi]